MGLSLSRNPEVCALSESSSAEEFCGGEALFPFELNFKEFQPGVFGAGGKETVAFDMNLSGLSGN